MKLFTYFERRQKYFLSDGFSFFYATTNDCLAKPYFPHQCLPKPNGIESIVMFIFPFFRNWTHCSITFHFIWPAGITPANLQPKPIPLRHSSILQPLNCVVPLTFDVCLMEKALHCGLSVEIETVMVFSSLHDLRRNTRHFSLILSNSAVRAR